MSSFTDANFVKKLSELNNTQQSIQTLSLWLIHHRKHSKTIVDVWQREMCKAKISKKLVFVYLANDVIQNSKKKGPEFTKDFMTVLPSSMKVISNETDEKLKGSVGRVLAIWGERGVYEKEFVADLQKQLTGSPSQPTTSYIPPPEKKTPSRKSSLKTDSKSDQPPSKKKKQILSLKEEVDALLEGQDPVKPDAEELMKRLADLETTASGDAGVREKIAALPPEVSDMSNLERITDKESADNLSATVDEACKLLAEYNVRLDAELQERKQVAVMLRNFITTQKEQLQHVESKLMEYRLKLSKMNAIRHELKSHVQNLPDLTLLPDVTGGLAPLPSAGDLFSL
ncbi:regulation of nuclear pre-mRNA domain-containing protein 1B [Patella vulgata]|uniref:regulation of nuclear pre-mRNA domain-containing protein 1B n=1 Tax=Patella vulgata TaxID=6465 RepID=UPI00218074BA|nr:regulation of nuclear pre-mRNA domain-containing protein 1B [Patella vulgata]